MRITGWTRGLLVLSLGGVLIAGCAASFFKEKTVAERFDTAMKKLAERCAKNPPKPGNTDCDPLKLTSADPLATEEGRFAHSIKIPNPLPEDSGYMPAMTTEQYFDHLCKAEAGEFIYKTVENVAGIMQMRPREPVTDYMLQHLYTLEDPYGETYGEQFNIGPEALKVGTIQSSFVNPSYSDSIKGGHTLYKPDQNYKFFEKPIPPHLQNSVDGSKYLRYTRPNTDNMVIDNGRYLYPIGQEPKMIEERAIGLKSKYGFIWRGIKRAHDREYGIAGGEVIILDIQTKDVLAVRRGYLRTANIRETGGRVWWLGAWSCPSNRPGADTAFIRKVLKPSTSVN